MICNFFSLNSRFSIFYQICDNPLVTWFKSFNFVPFLVLEILKLKWAEFLKLLTKFKNSNLTKTIDPAFTALKILRFYFLFFWLKRAFSPYQLEMSNFEYISINSLALLSESFNISSYLVFEILSFECIPFVIFF